MALAAMAGEVTALAAIFAAVTAALASFKSSTAPLTSAALPTAPAAIKLASMPDADTRRLPDASTVIATPVLICRKEPTIEKLSVDAGRNFRKSKVPVALPIDSVFCGVAPTSVFVRLLTSKETSLAVTVVAEDGFGIFSAIGDGVAATDDSSVDPLYTRNSTPPHVTSDGAVNVAVMRCWVLPSEADTVAAAKDAPVTWDVYSVPAAPDAGGDTLIVATGVPTAGERPSVFGFALLSRLTA